MSASVSNPQSRLENPKLPDVNSKIIGFLPDKNPATAAVTMDSRLIFSEKMKNAQKEELISYWHYALNLNYGNFLAALMNINLASFLQDDKTKSTYKNNLQNCCLFNFETTCATYFKRLASRVNLSFLSNRPYMVYNLWETNRIVMRIYFDLLKFLKNCDLTPYYKAKDAFIKSLFASIFDINNSQAASLSKLFSENYNINNHFNAYINCFNRYTNYQPRTPEIIFSFHSKEIVSAYQNNLVAAIDSFFKCIDAQLLGDFSDYPYWCVKSHNALTNVINNCKSVSSDNLEFVSLCFKIPDNEFIVDFSFSLKSAVQPTKVIKEVLSTKLIIKYNIYDDADIRFHLPLRHDYLLVNSNFLDAILLYLKAVQLYKLWISNIPSHKKIFKKVVHNSTNLAVGFFENKTYSNDFISLDFKPILASNIKKLEAIKNFDIDKFLVSDEFLRLASVSGCVGKLENKNSQLFAYFKIFNLFDNLLRYSKFNFCKLNQQKYNSSDFVEISIKELLKTISFNVTTLCNKSRHRISAFLDGRIVFHNHKKIKSLNKNADALKELGSDHNFNCLNFVNVLFQKNKSLVHYFSFLNNLNGRYKNISPTTKENALALGYVLAVINHFIKYCNVNKKVLIPEKLLETKLNGLSYFQLASLLQQTLEINNLAEFQSVQLYNRSIRFNGLCFWDTNTKIFPFSPLIFAINPCKGSLSLSNFNTAVDFDTVGNIGLLNDKNTINSDGFLMTNRYFSDFSSGDMLTKCNKPYAYLAILCLAQAIFNKYFLFKVWEAIPQYKKFLFILNKNYPVSGKDLRGQFTDLIQQGPFVKHGPSAIVYKLKKSYSLISLLHICDCLVINKNTDFRKFLYSKSSLLLQNRAKDSLTTEFELGLYTVLNTFFDLPVYRLRFILSKVFSGQPMHTIYGNDDLASVIIK